MRKSIIAALAASVIAVPAYAADIVLPPAAPIAPPAPTAAAPTVAGYIGVYGGALYEFGFGAVAAVAVDAAVARSMQRMDFQIELRDQTYFTGGAAASFAAAIVHAYRRNSNAAFGAFGGYEALFSGGGIAANVFHIGAEALMFRARTTLYAQVAGVFLSTAGWGGYIRGVARFFPRDNVRLEGGVRYLYLAGGGNIITPEIEGEFQLPGRALSFVATGRYTFVISGGGGSVITALGGIRFHFGGGDLIDQGAPMDTNPLLF